MNVRHLFSVTSAALLAATASAVDDYSSRKAVCFAFDDAANPAADSNTMGYDNVCKVVGKVQVVADPDRGSVAHFDGKGYLLGLGNNHDGLPGLPAGNRDFTIAFWAKPAVDAANEVFSLGSTCNFGSRGAHAMLMIRQTTSDDGSRWRLSEGILAPLSAEGSLKVGEWQHVAFVHSAAATNFSVYVNGALSGALDVEPLNLMNSEFALGRAFNDGRFFVGDLDDFTIYHAALPASAIAALASESADTVTPYLNRRSVHFAFDDAANPAQESNTLGYRNLATTVGAVQIVNDPDRGSVAAFDGASYIKGSATYAILPGLPAGNADFTVAYWAKPDVAASNDQNQLFIWGANETYGGRDAGAFFMGRQAPDQSDSWRIGDGTDFAVSTAGTFKPGAWQHVALVHDGTARTYRIYVNGELSGTVAATNVKLRQDGFALGRGWNDAVKYKGLLDDFIVFPTALKDAAVAALAADAPASGSAGGFWYDNPFVRTSFALDIGASIADAVNPRFMNMDADGSRLTLNLGTTALPSKRFAVAGLLSATGEVAVDPAVETVARTGMLTIENFASDMLDTAPDGRRFSNLSATEHQGKIAAWRMLASGTCISCMDRFTTTLAHIRNVTVEDVLGRTLVYAGEGDSAGGKVVVVDATSAEAAYWTETTLTASAAASPVTNVKVSGPGTSRARLHVQHDDGTIEVYALAPDGLSLASATPLKTLSCRTLYGESCAVGAVDGWCNFEVTRDGRFAFLVYRNGADTKLKVLASAGALPALASADTPGASAVRALDTCVPSCGAVCIPKLRTTPAGLFIIVR